MEQVTVLVVGAGPTGLTAAAALAARHVDVRIVDRASGPATTSRANILHARGVQVLERLGALGTLPDQAVEPRGMAMHVGGRRLSTMRFAPLEGESVQALFVSQASVEAELRRRAEELGVRVEWNRRVTALDQDGDGVTVSLADGTSVRAAYVVGCDGAHSTVRDLVGIPFPGVPVVEKFLLADVHARWDRDRSTSAGWFHRDGILLAIPMPDAAADGEARGDLWRLMADVSDVGEERLDERRILERFATLVPERTGGAAMEIRDAVWTSVFRIHRRLAADYRRERVLLAGDAAHIHSPIGGQGLNTGIGDAENLAWKLALVARGRAGDRLLDSYTLERRPLARTVLQNTTANTRILVGEGPLTRLIRDRVLVPLLGLPSVQANATRNASQLWVTYAKGPLGRGARGRRPRPGDRVHDLDCLRPDGTRTRLYAALGASWALLVPSGALGMPEAEELHATARAHLGDDEVTLLSPAEPSAESSPADDRLTALLVRPDGHLGWEGALTAPAALTDWSNSVLHEEKATA